jgi:hypothetical protein
MRTKVATGHVPRPQQKLLHAAPGRFKVLVTHRRFGKTVFAVNELISGARRCALPQPHFAYLAPFHVQAKDVAWSYLKHYTAKIPDVTVSESELWVELPPRIEHGADAGGARIRLYGADNADRLRGLYFDGVVLDEYAQMHPRVWSEVVRPALADRSGWALFIGTPMGRNGFCELFEGARDGFAHADGERRRDPDWAGFMFKASETGIIPRPELEAAQRTMSPDQYAQEFECSFDAAIPGAYYAQVLGEAEQLGRIRPIAYEPALPVHTGWDLGIGDPLPADTLEGGFDRAAMRDQQLKDGQDRALTFPPTIPAGVSAELPFPTALDFLRWNATADGLENADVLSLGAVGFPFAGGVFADGDATTPIAFASDTNTGIFRPATDAIAFSNGGAETMRLTSANRLVIGHTSTVSGFSYRANIVGFNSEAGQSMARFSADVVAPRLDFVKSRAASPGSLAVVQSGDNVLEIRAFADDGVDYQNAVASIRMDIDGTPGSNDTPGRIVFSTAPDGSNSVTERLRIGNDGSITHRSNATLIVDANSHLTLRTYTVATLPPAAVQRLIYVSDGTANKRLAVSDGTNWRFPDGNVVT